MLRSDYHNDQTIVLFLRMSEKFPSAAKSIKKLCNTRKLNLTRYMNHAFPPYMHVFPKLVQHQRWMRLHPAESTCFQSRDRNESS